MRSETMRNKNRPNPPWVGLLHLEVSEMSLRDFRQEQQEKERQLRLRRVSAPTVEE